MINKTFFLLVFIFLSEMAQGQIKAGPMNGYSAMREVLIWLQLEQEGNVAIRYYDDSTKSTITSQQVGVSKENHYIAKVTLTGLEPGRKYQYDVLVDNNKIDLPYQPTFETQKLWQFRTDPPEFSFLVGSCFFINEAKYDRPGRGYGGEYEILEKMAEQNAEFMIWLGDNNYLREVDYDSKSGVYHRYSHSRSPQEMQKLLATKHHFATWDDHDYGPNDSDYTYFGKEWTRRAFTDFWGNPVYGVNGLESITGGFYWGDCAFFVLDNRWYRDEHEGTLLGKDQLDWFLDALDASKASYNFVLIGGQVLNTAQLFENYANFPEERAYLLDQIDKRRIRNVVFLTGDRHHSELSKLKTPSGKIVYDITSSPVTSSAHGHENEGNHLRVQGSHIGERNFAKITVSGAYRKRKVHLQYFNKLGEMLYEYTLTKE